jgi:PLP dependent protein
MSDLTQQITEQINHIRHTLAANVRLIVVSKYVSADHIRIAYRAGIRDFGENRVQEAIAKQTELADLTDINWHLIGHLQTNKAKLATTHFAWIHTLDSLDLADRLDRYAAELNHPLNLLLQVKLLPDANKSGWTVEQLWQVLPRLDQYQHLHICGLMTILPMGLTEPEQLLAFQDLQHLAQTIRQHPWSRLQIQELSMGMSGDYMLAIQAGATMIRLGTLIFGSR